MQGLIKVGGVVLGERTGEVIHGVTTGLDITGRTDSTAKVNKLLAAGKVIHLNRDDVLSCTSQLDLSTNGCGIVGGTLSFNNVLLQNPVWVFIQGTDCVIQNTVLDFNNGSCYAGIRNAAGAARLQVLSVTMKNAMGRNATNTQSVTGLWIETQDSPGFHVDNVHIQDMYCVGNGVEGDTTGSITGVLLRKYKTQPVGGSIGTLTFENVFTVDTSGIRVVEDADFIKTMGWHYCPVTVGRIQGSNVGKRVVKTQAYGLVVNSIQYTHTDNTVLHRCVVDHQASNNYVGDIHASGFIHTGYGTTSPYDAIERPTEFITKSGFGSLVLDTTYTAPDTVPTGTNGGVNINAGRGLELGHITVSGGVVGVKIRATDPFGVSDITLQGDVRSAHAMLVLNTSTTFGPIENINVTGHFRSTANNTAPGFAVLSTGGSIGSINLADLKLVALGTYSTGARLVGQDVVRLHNVESNTVTGTSLEIQGGVVLGTGLNERQLNKTSPVLFLQDCDGGNVSGVLGGKPTGTSVGLVHVLGCKNIQFSNVMNVSTGQNITFLDSSTGTCAGCIVDTSTSRVSAPSDYTDQHVLWYGAPAFGTTAIRRNIVPRGFMYRSTDDGRTRVWSGFNWVTGTW